MTDDSMTIAPTTNTLGLPLMRQALADVMFHVIADDDINEPKDTPDQKIARSAHSGNGSSSLWQQMSLLGVLNNYNQGNYKLNPVIVQEQDYNSIMEAFPMVYFGQHCTTCQNTLLLTTTISAFYVITGVLMFASTINSRLIQFEILDHKTSFGYTITI